MTFTLRFIILAAFVAFGCKAQAATTNEQVGLSAECRVAMRLVTSPDYVKDHHGEIPDEGTMDENSKLQFVARLFEQSISKAADPVQFCSNTIQQNLSYTNAYHLPKQCVDFLPLLKTSFEEKVSYTKGMDASVKQKMDDALVEMLILDETAPDKLISRCEVGIQVMHVDLNDKHLKEKYPLPVSCEVFFADMEKSLILPSQLDTIKRQRVIFALENKNTPKKLDEICEEISH